MTFQSIVSHICHTQTNTITSECHNVTICHVYHFQSFRCMSIRNTLSESFWNQFSTCFVAYYYIYATNSVFTSGKPNDNATWPRIVPTLNSNMKTAVVFEDGKCTVNIRHMEYSLQQKQQLQLIKTSRQMLQH